MNIVVTGSLGYIGRPLTEKLVKKGHLVTVVSTHAERGKEIEALGAQTAIGNMDDAEFLTRTFTGSDAVYCMIALEGGFNAPDNHAGKVIAQADTIAHNYLQAIETSGVKRVVYLSSMGADMTSNSGLIIIHHHAENTLNHLPSDVNISFIRPAGFYKGLLNYIPAIKHQNRITANFGGEDVVLWVSNTDIADAVVEELETRHEGRIVRYVAGDELTCTETARILGSAIGKPGLRWEIVSDIEQYEALKAFGMQESFARNFTEMNASIHNGRFYEDYYRNPTALGYVKMKDFAGEFATRYRQ